ncbi:MAG TPA: efflux transporter outer membrane subunit [Anaeromyxobacteraceae bacterium]|nr:efflux transporter outer membrane subunit [Anaeromyxobacteraceae bacterium]
MTRPRPLPLRPHAGLWGAALLALAAGCSVGPNYNRPPVSAPVKWEVTEPWREAVPKDAVPKSHWWSLFRDGDLETMEADLLSANETLKGAVAHLDQARASAAVQNASLFPSLSVAPAAGVERYSGNRPSGSTATFSPVTQSNYLLPFTLSYEVDLFGSVRRSIESAQAAYQASAADLENVRLVLTAELAADYFTLRQLDTEIAILNRNVENLRKGLELMKSRYAGGIASSLDVAQEETLLNATRTQATLLLLQRKQFEDAIAVLVGKPAPDFHVPAQELAAEPPRIDGGLPSDVLERRPDVAEAERQMAAANAQIGVATAAYFPSLALTGQGGWNSMKLSQLFNPASAFWAVMATLTQAIFDGGARGAQVDYSRAGYEAALASYRATVLNAFREVQDSLTGLEVLETARQSQAEAVASSRRQLDLATSRYVGGLVSYLDVVIAQQNLLANEQQAAVIQGQRLVTSVLLVKALGGGWDAGSLDSVRAAPRVTDAFVP